MRIRSQNYRLRAVHFLKCAVFFLVFSSYAKGPGTQGSDTGGRKSGITLQLKDRGIEEAFGLIEKHTDLRFSYDRNDLDKKIRLNKNFNRVGLEEILDYIGNTAHLEFRKVNNVINVIRLNHVRLTGNEFQERTITGVVTDPEGIPVPGANVVEIGTSAGTATDFDGNFTLKLTADHPKIRVSFIGYKTIEVAIGEAAHYNIVLREDAQALEGVVMVGYGTQKKADLTGAVSTISSEKLESRPLVNLGQGLQGLIPNLNVNLQNGRPGEGATFNIRGNTSINASSPLVLVDGVVMDPNLINPSDVESVTVLKDAASASIYGARAASGVILITTKRGQKNTPVQINYSSSYTVTRPTRMPDYLNSVDYIKMHREADRNGQISGGSTASTPFTERDLELATAYFNDPVNNSPVYVDPANPSRYRYVGNTDWIDVMYPGTAPMQEHKLSVSGGSEKTSYIASLGYMNQKGLLKVADDNFERYNAGLKVSTEATDWLDLNFSMSLNYTDNNRPNTASHGGTSSGWISGDLRPIMPVYHPDGNYSGQGSFTNMVAMAKLNGRWETTENDLWLTGGFVLKPFKNFRWTTDFTWNNYNYNDMRHYKEYPEYGVDGILLGTFPWTTPSSVREENSNDYYTALNSFMEYENTFGKHYVKGMIGYNQELKQVKSFSATARNLIDQEKPAINLNNDDRPGVGGRQSEWAISGAFFRANYVYDERYLLQVSGRYDGSSRFPKDNRFVFFPSVSAGWRISNETFFEPLKEKVNELKIRYSYGMLGNQDIEDSFGNYPYIPVMGTSRGGHIFDNQREVFVNPPGLVSSGFTWEKVSTHNFGLDVSAFKNRMHINFDWFIRDTRDMIIGAFPLPAILGTPPPVRNAADMRTKGWELSVAWSGGIGEDFSYNVGLALSDYMSTITKYDLNPESILSDRYEGQKRGEIWGYTTEGFFQSDDAAAQADQSRIWGGTWMAGDIQYKDLNGDGIIDFGDNTLDNPGDRSVIGNRTPRYQFGLNFSSNYKNFDFGFLFQGVGKRDVVVGDNTFWGFLSEWHVPMQHHKDYWTPENPDAYYPRLRFGGGGNFEAQTKYIQNAAYGRLKSITLGYSLPGEVLDKIGLYKLRLYVTGQNLFEITQLHKAFDPEIFEPREYPLNRGVSFGIQVGL
ncbi:SusC/RagA family TonB-linked outer membrane protein [Sinomicrobium weinanense]|uniref:SusC/RagA family TonB-linked outer membrane protein n=1 Tax=Sinomicrobium weinanense TaxID=2842200 RepID=A0A926Q3Z1_9FLAO|nr:SusC/RagA family TonB-linked outer membrane protein [Sinomicrobium weinanense]MBC9797424.1 SusC/RagA family TonB-linked outer membrane protein [Sinomicrobium weinanense]MBU3123082.1 SusC/RagA family TonB-linked outer membrane protein [Sinomicrobium weinanense]